MVIKWINHASYLTEVDDLKIVTDPWLEGTAFNDGWALLSPTQFRYEDFEDVTHIWFSHEHPDHFVPSNLKKISAGARSRITVLYQESIDKKVVNYCKSLGFKSVLELKQSSWLSLTPSVSIICESVDGGGLMDGP